MDLPAFISVFYATIMFALISQILAKMTQDVEMKEQQPAPAADNSVSLISPSVLERKCLNYMYKSVNFQWIILDFGVEMRVCVFVCERERERELGVATVWASD